MDADWPMIGIRLALYSVLGALFGLSAFHLYAVPQGERIDERVLGSWLAAGSLIALLVSALGLVLQVAAMTGMPPWLIDFDAVGVLLSASALGLAWKTRMVALVLVGVAAAAAVFAGPRRSWLGVVVAAAGVALSTLAWNGHGAMDEGTRGMVHLAADIFHLVAAGAWTGALLGLLRMVMRRSADFETIDQANAHRALHRFGTVGVLVVVTLVVTGLINAWLLIGLDGIEATTSTLYGRLLLTKLALFAVMLGIAALNRLRLTPSLARPMVHEDRVNHLNALRWSLAVETTIILLILGLVGWLGTLAPPSSTVP